MSQLNTQNIDYDLLTVQELWNVIENLMIECIDKCSPIMSLDQNFEKISNITPSHIKNAMSKKSDRVIE